MATPRAPACSWSHRRGDLDRVAHGSSSTRSRRPHFNVSASVGEGARAGESRSLELPGWSTGPNLLSNPLSPPARPRLRWRGDPGSLTRRGRRARTRTPRRALPATRGSPLPGSGRGRLNAWSLNPDGPATHGECALVLRSGGAGNASYSRSPGRTSRRASNISPCGSGTAAAPSASWRPTPAPTPCCSNASPPPTSAASAVLEACEEIGRLFTLLDRPAGPQFDTLADAAPRWQARLGAGTPLVPRRTAAGGVRKWPGSWPIRSWRASCTPTCTTRTCSRSARAVQAAGSRSTPSPWRPSGRSRWPRSSGTGSRGRRAHSVRTHVRLRADLVTDAAGLDEDRVQAWTHVRLVLNAVDARRTPPPPTPSVPA